MNENNTSIVICCAGMGSRLGIDTTKSLLNISGKPLIIHQLEQLDNFTDIRIVVGYQARQIIDTVNKYRKDIMFAFNYDYATTGPASSLQKGLLGSKKYIVSIDGDTIFNTKDFKNFLNIDKDCIAYSNISSEEPILINCKDNYANEFSKNGNYEWPGLVKIESKKLIKKRKYIYEILKDFLPMNSFYVRSRGINTVNDYKKAIEWFKNGCID